MARMKKCCCCCGPLSAPTSTELVSPAGETKAAAAWTNPKCCKTVTLNITTPTWTNICSPAVRTQTINESFNYDVYTRQLQVEVTGPGGPALDCQVNKITGEVVCTPVDSNGDPITCEIAQTLCTTIAQSASQTKSLHVIARWRATKIELSIYRVKIKCGSETEPTCKFIAVARQYVQIQYGNAVKVARTRTLTGATSCCVLNADYNLSIPALSCADLLAGSSLTTENVIFTRSKVFNEMPSGEITFNEGDVIDCDTHPLKCVDPIGYDSIELLSSNVGLWGTVTAACVNNTVAMECLALYDFGGVECYYFNIGPTTRQVGTVTSNLLVSLETSVQYVCNPASGADANPDTVNCNQKRIWDLICRDLTQSITDTGYTATSLTISTGAWVINITP